jgi:hypothetical protein
LHRREFRAALRSGTSVALETRQRVPRTEEIPMKTIALALACIAAIAPPAAAADDTIFVPVCPPRWLTDALRDLNIQMSCPMDDEGGAEEARRPFDRKENAEDATDTIPRQREAPVPDGDHDEAFRELWIQD